MYIYVCIYIYIYIYIYMYTLDFFISKLGFCLELGLLNSETKIGSGVA